MLTETLMLNRTHRPRKHARRYVANYARRTRHAIEWRQGTRLNQLIARLLLLENCVVN